MRNKGVVIAAILGLLMAGFPSASNALSLPACTVNGTAGSDRLTGTAGNDVICGGSGNDTILGLGGNDLIFGGPGNDRILGGEGGDEILGEAGMDYLDGGSGADDISGGSLTDRLIGGLGDDELSGGIGSDVILGDGGADLIQGEQGSDLIQGGTGNDLIDGGQGRDSIRTGSGTDSCSGDPADSFLDSCTIDRTAPEIGAQVTVVRSFEAGSNITLNWSVSDSTGVEKSWGSIGGQPGWITNWCGFGIEAQRVSGDSKNGSYQIQCQVPENAVNETYSLFVSAVDLLGNSTTYSPQIAFMITGGSSDSKAPETTEINLESSVKPGGELSIAVSTNDETGVAGVYGWMMKDGGGFASYPDIGLYADALGAATLISGSNKSGTYSQTLRFSPKAPEGSYTLWLSLSDEVGNRTFVETNKKVLVTN